MKLKLLFLIFTMIFSIVIIQNYPIRNDYWAWDGLFIAPNIIKINGYDNKYQYKQKLVHEYSHYLCYTLFDDMFCNDKEWEAEDSKLRI